MIEMHPEVLVGRLKPGDETGFARTFELLRMLHAETPHAQLSLPKLHQGLADVIEQGVVVVSVTRAGELAGTVGLAEESPWFSDDRWLSDRFFFVHPRHRRTPHARCLLDAARLVARDMKLPLHMAVTGYGDRTAGKVRLFSRALGEPCGAIWIVRSAH